MNGCAFTLSLVSGMPTPCLNVCRDNAGMLISAAVSTTPTFSSGRLEPLFSTAPFVPGRFAVAPDGSRFLFLQRAGNASERLMFVESWTRALDKPR